MANIRLPSRNEIPAFVHWLRARKYVVDTRENVWDVGSVTVNGEKLPMFCDKTKRFSKVLLPAPLQTLFDKHLFEKEFQQRKIGRHDVSND
jgi:hypothetical protein